MNLRSRLGEIKGRTLACDCEIGDPCHIDFLAAAANETEAGNTSRISVKRPPALVAAALLGIAATRHVAGCSIPRQMKVRWPQESIERCLKKLLPYEMTANMKIPMLEDLVNHPPFTDYYEWRETECLSMDMGCGPAIVTEIPRGSRAILEGEQRGALYSKGAFPQVVDFALTEEEHFQQCKQMAEAGVFPMKDRGFGDDDLGLG